MVRMYARKEAASAFGVSVRTVQRMEARGELRSIRIGGQVRISDVEIMRVVAPTQKR